MTFVLQPAGGDRDGRTGTIRLSRKVVRGRLTTPKSHTLLVE
jgi:hypothetical protein